MILGGDADGKIGARIALSTGIRTDKAIFSESSGFVFEAEKSNVGKVKAAFEKYGIKVNELGETGGNELVVNGGISITIDEMRKAWTSGLKEALE